MEINKFMMRMNERPNASEQADADFASACNWVFGHVKGILKEKTMIVIIGQLFDDDDRPGPIIGHQLIVAPESFWTPIGLSNESAVHIPYTAYTYANDSSWCITRGKHHLQHTSLLLSVFLHDFASHLKGIQYFSILVVEKYSTP